MIAGSSQNLATPAAPTVTIRTAGSNETALSATSGTTVRGRHRAELLRGDGGQRQRHRQPDVELRR